MDWFYPPFSGFSKISVGSNFLRFFNHKQVFFVYGCPYWDLSGSLERHSVLLALKKAIMRRRPGKDLMIHSDRGVQYASQDFKTVLTIHGFIQSMSRKGDRWDNAVAESFFHTLKTQLIYHIRLYNFREAERILFKYIEVYYNQRRKHSANAWKPTANCEQEWYNLKKVV